MSDAKVVPFRKRALTPKAALELLRRVGKDGPVTVASYPGLGDMLGWDRKRTWNQVTRWEKAGKVATEKDGDDLKSITALPDLKRGGGTGVAKPKRPQKTRRKAAAGVLKTVPDSVLKTPPANVLNSNVADVLKVQNQTPESNTYDNHLNSQVRTKTPAPGVVTVDAAVPPFSDLEYLHGARPDTSTSTSNSDVAETVERAPAKPLVPPPLDSHPAHLPADGRVMARPKGGGGDGPGFDAIDAFSRASFAEKVFLLAALGLSGTAAYISVEYGMSVLYMAGAPVILVLGGFIELAKFAGVSVVSSGWSRYSFFSKWAMAFLLFLAAVVNAAAVYGWLIASHAGPAASRTATYTQQDAGQGASIEAAQARLADYDKQIAQIDDAIAAATKRGRTRDALRIVDQQKRNRATLVAARDKEQQALGSLRTGRSTTAASRQVDEANNMPIRYGALLFEDIGLLAPGTDPEKLIRWLSAMILMCGDPMALAGMWMISSRMRRRGGTP
jgi:hypothetical protein